MGRELTRSARDAKLIRSGSKEGTSVNKEQYTATLSVLDEGEELVERPETIELRVLSGALQGESFLLSGKRTFSVGRGKGNDLVLPDASVSSAHVELSLSRRGVEIRDKGSSNGTRVGRALIQAATLLEETEFRVGECRLLLGPLQPVAVAATRAEEFCGIVGRSARMRELFSKVERLAPTPLSTLLLGETGTGKEMFAQALHERSGRTGRLVTLDCASLPPQLAESVILGHRRGAFTGATEDRPGVFEEADGGTLFLDELGELPSTLQPKLLRVLQERVVHRIGDTRGHPVDVRVVAATNRSLSDMVSDGTFRLDLFERIRQVELELPPLRERPEDITSLAARFAAAVGERLGDPRVLNSGALTALSSRPWPGNVRGLKNAVERGAYLCRKPPNVTVADFDFDGGEIDAPRDDSGPLPIAPTLFDLPLKEAAAINDMQFRRQFCVRVLQDTGSNLSEAARRLGYSRKGLRELLHKLGVERQSTTRPPGTQGSTPVS